MPGSSTSTSSELRDRERSSRIVRFRQSGKNARPSHPPTAGFAQPAGFAGAEQCSANSPLRPAPTIAGPTAVLLTATSRDDKLWPADLWIKLGCALHARGMTCLLPAGSAAERERAAQIAQAIPDASVLPPMSLADLAGQLASARIVIGVDTGLVHLAAALGRPVLALFSASDPALTGVLASTPAINLGARGQPPAVDDVLEAAAPLL
jgi:heptosyltransferase-1